MIRFARWAVNGAGRAQQHSQPSSSVATSALFSQAGGRSSSTTASTGLKIAFRKLEARAGPGLHPVEREAVFGTLLDRPQHLNGTFDRPRACPRVKAAL
jgi:hypothetical protein